MIPRKFNNEPKEKLYALVKYRSLQSVSDVQVAKLTLANTLGDTWGRNEFKVVAQHSSKDGGKGGKKIEERRTMSKVNRLKFYRLFTLEKVEKVVGCEIITIGEAYEKEIDFRPGGHLLEHGDKLVAIDPPAIGWRFHRVKLLWTQKHTHNKELDAVIISFDLQYVIE
jgi:hypothetical protein